jgi:hypothetical protein
VWSLGAQTENRTSFDQALQLRVLVMIVDTRMWLDEQRCKPCMHAGGVALCGLIQGVSRAQFCSPLSIDMHKFVLLWRGQRAQRLTPTAYRERTDVQFTLVGRLLDSHKPLACMVGGTEHVSGRASRWRDAHQ